MKKYAVLGAVVLAVAMGGCKNKMEKVADLQAQYDMAGKTYRVDCPLVNDAGQPDMGGHWNTSPKCLEEKKHYDDIHRQILDAQREASQ